MRKGSGKGRRRKEKHILTSKATQRPLRSRTIKMSSTERISEILETFFKLADKCLCLSFSGSCMTNNLRRVKLPNTLLMQDEVNCRAILFPPSCLWKSLWVIFWLRNFLGDDGCNEVISLTFPSFSFTSLDFIASHQTQQDVYFQTGKRDKVTKHTLKNFPPKKKKRNQTNSFFVRLTESPNVFLRIPLRFYFRDLD